MLWKIGKQIKTKILFSLFHRPWSMTFHLVLIYTLSAFCVLFICVLFLYWIFVSRLEKDNYFFLVHNVNVLETILQTQTKSKPSAFRDALNEEVVLEPSMSHYYVRLVNDQGVTFMETPNMEKLIPKEEFAKIAPESPGTFPTKYYINPTKKNHKKHFLIVNALVNQSGNVSKHWNIQIAKDISSEHDIIIDYRRGLLLVLIMGVIGSAVLGVLVTRKGLKPLREMTRSTQQITISRLQERLNPASWPYELSNLALAFNHMLDRITEGFTRLSQFSGDLAHELRTPITNLMGEAEIALSRKRTNEEYREVLESSIEELSRIAFMIENLLFLARAENPKSVLQLKSLSVDKVMKDMCEFYEALADEKGVKLLYQGEGQIHADPLMLRRAMSNLVSNALKYSPAGSSITLNSKEDDRYVYISVEDQGQGIASEHLPHIFDRFYRVDSARSQNTGGTGLGLAIVKFIVELHKGKVGIKSEVGQGTRIVLSFAKDNSF